MIASNSVDSNSQLDTICFTTSATYKTLRKQKESFSAGPDGFPPILFRRMARCLSWPLTLMNRAIFTCGFLPKIWNHALVTPIFKKGCSSNVANYRPISLTCVACKIFESSIKDQIINHLLKTNILNDSQHGFLAKHSTSTNLLQSLNDWTINLKNRHQTRVVAIDFARAFDSVCFSKLLLKLKYYCLGSSILKIIESFLSNRTQCVVLDNIHSDQIKLSSGVPQGSVLGPLLFIIYINDLSQILTPGISLKLFADDAKLYTEIKTAEDIDGLQLCVDNLSRWANEWQLSISICKCASIDIGNINDYFCENMIDGELLKSVTELKDLGIIIDQKLTFSSHIIEMVAKAKQRIFLLFRTFRTRDRAPLLIAYKSYILPLVNYCSSVWSPQLLGDIYSIESVQRLFTRMMAGLEQMSYTDRLHTLKLPTLELRRLRSDLVLCYKILNGQIAGDIASYGLKYCSTNTRGHNYKLFVEHSKIETRRNYFGNRIVKPWNSLSVETVNASSVQMFKSYISNCSFTEFLSCV